jgi:hypothetical protein
MMNWERLLMVSPDEVVANTDLFATALYTGSASTRTITNGINLSERGGLVWIKARNETQYTNDHFLQDTARGTGKAFRFNRVNSSFTETQTVTSFNIDGFNLGLNSEVNSNGINNVAWSFAAHPKFMSIVEWSGNSTSGRTIAHGLGATPAFFIIKNKTTNSNFTCYHHSINAGAGGAARPQDFSIAWNDEDTATVTSSLLNNTAPDATNITLNNDALCNGSGNDYIGYFFAHHSTGGTQVNGKNLISCGSYVGDGDSDQGPIIDCGFDGAPRFIMIKGTSLAASDAKAPVVILDSTRGIGNAGLGGDPFLLISDTTFEENIDSSVGVTTTSSGFRINGQSHYINLNLHRFVYVAIA